MYHCRIIFLKISETNFVTVCSIGFESNLHRTPALKKLEAAHEVNNQSFKNSAIAGLFFLYIRLSNSVNSD